MDIGFIKENKWFRLRACGVIVKDNKILMCKNNVDDYYYSVGGAVEHNEIIENAAIREVLEETGYNMEIDKLLFIHQNFFNKDNISYHEVSFYYLMKEIDDEISGYETKLSSNKTENTVWLDIKQFETEKVYPKCLPKMLDNKKVEIIIDYEK